jgi:hypothetical protein
VGVMLMASRRRPRHNRDEPDEDEAAGGEQ